MDDEKKHGADLEGGGGGGALLSPEQTPQKDNNTAFRIDKATAALLDISVASSSQVPPSTQEESLSGWETLTNEDDENDDAGSASLYDIYAAAEEEKPTILQRLCLNSRYSLRTQLMLSFGTVNCITILFVVGICIVIAYTAGQNVKAINQASFEELLTGIEGTTARYLAESLSPRLIPQDVVKVMYEATRDRFSGYPTGGLSDEFVPFFDIESETNQYPLRGKRLPLDWQVKGTVNQNNFQEHVQNRWTWYGSDLLLSTSNGVYYMQGMCDPKAVSFDMTYWPNCTEANNNLKTGGVVTPSPTNEEIYHKASDLTPILKALYEQNQDIQDLGIYFANSGAGSVLSYPAFRLRTSNTYESHGCRWMELLNPYDSSRPIGTQDEIRRCRPEGEVVSSRIYNPLERTWCRDQARDPERLHIVGPYRDAWHDDNWVLGSGRAVYDRVTNDFIACLYVGSSTSVLEQTLHDARITEQSHVSLVRWDNRGTVVASTAFNIQEAGQVAAITELDIGVSTGYYQQLLELVDYELTEWDPVQVQAMYESYTMKAGGYSVSSYPIPPVPDEYDASYKPEFVVIISTSEEAEIFASVQVANNDVNESVLGVIYLALMVAAGGLLLAAIIIFFMSRALTAPLHYMNNASDEIMNSIGAAKQVDGGSERNIKTGEPTYIPPRCSPRTELGDVVEEFNKMILTFSGPTASKSSKKHYKEASNDFRLASYFKDLYHSRQEDSFAYKTGNFNEKKGFDASMAGLEAANDSLAKLTTDGLAKLHFGSNTKGTIATASSGGSFSSNITAPSMARSVRSVIKSNRLRFDSPLFFWTVVLIATPLILATVAISTIVMLTVSREFAQTIQDSKAAFVNVEIDALEIYARLRAELVAADLLRPLLRIHLLTRYSNWLLFGGLEKSDSYTRVSSLVEECKEFDNISACGYPEKDEVCDCAWLDRDVCSDYPEFYSRYYQVVNWASESLDTYPNGDRNSTSFPEVSYSPETTAWWPDQQTLPGSERGSSALGHNTTYDRLRGASAVPIFVLNHNSDENKEFFLSNYIGFEAEGMFMGYGGCGKWEWNSRWSASEGNGASLLRPDICPVGKYGYDPRCRDWYHSGRALYLEDNDILQHITPPYQFAGSSDFYGQSATGVVFDPETKELVGQTLLDFSTDFSALNSDNTRLSEGGFAMLITSQADSFGGETVVGPNSDEYSGEGAAPIASLVMPVDYNCTSAPCIERRQSFEAIVDKMKQGRSGVAVFDRTSPESADSFTDETDTIHIAYAPVKVFGYGPIDSSTFERGVQQKEYHIYSLGMAETEAGLLQPFEQVENDMTRQINTSIAILSVVIVVATVIVVWISYRVTMSFTHTVLFLLEWVKKINRLRPGEQPPGLNRDMGCAEMVKVADAMDSLYKVVRCSNADYFAGDIENAYKVLDDGLRMFKRLKNKKAVAVASNNLGNICLAMYRMQKAAGKKKKVAGLSKKEIVSRGITYFDDAIRIGEQIFTEMFESPTWNPECMSFKQHVANRYFNRAMFLLTIKDNHEKQPELKQKGLSDLKIVHDMDAQLAAQGEQEAWTPDESSRRFSVALIRARGHISLMELGYPDDWGVAELIEDAYRTVLREQQEVKSPLFSAIRAVGMLQLIETELIKYKLLKGEIKTAAQIGVRMLVEDEFIVCDAQVAAVKALVAFLNSPESGRETHNMARVRLIAYQRTLFNTADEMDRSSRRSNRSSSDESRSEFHAAMKKTMGGSPRSLSSKSDHRRSRHNARENAGREDVVMETF